MSKRDRILLSVVAGLAVLGGFWFLAVKPKRAEIVAIDGRAAQAQQRRDAALADLASAREARVAFRRDRATLAMLGKAVPADEDIPSLLYQLNAAARTAKVDFASLKLGEGGTAAAPGAAPAAAAATPAATGSSDGKGTADAAGAAPAAPAPGAASLTPVPVQLSFTGDFLRLRRFLDTVHDFARPRGQELDVRGRLLTVDSVSLAPSGQGLPALAAQVSVTAYVSPPTAGTGGAGTGATPAAAPAAAAPATQTAQVTPSTTGDAK